MKKLSLLVVVSIALVACKNDSPAGDAPSASASADAGARPRPYATLARSAEPRPRETLATVEAQLKPDVVVAKTRLEKRVAGKFEKTPRPGAAIWVRASDDIRRADKRVVAVMQWPKLDSVDDHECANAAKLLADMVADAVGVGWNMTIALKGEKGWRAIFTRPSVNDTDAAIPEPTTGANAETKALEEALAEL